MGIKRFIYRRGNGKKTKKFLGGLTLDNNDILIRLRYALDIKDNDMVEIFKLGGVEITKEEVLKLLIKSKESSFIEDSTEDKEENIRCSNFMLESFLNGFIIFKRGRLESKEGRSERAVLTLKENKSANNVVLKKLKVALALTSEDMLEILEEAGVNLSKGELSAVFRKEGHKHYQVCGDRYVRNFLKGLAMRYR